jgi:glycosyltransferase involved in cell wall biosynthesis
MTLSLSSQDLLILARKPISACVICFNEEDNIKRCLESLKWVNDSGGEIIVVDSFSTDRTVEICQQFTNKVFQNRWLGYVNQKNYALSLASNEWVLSLDADEMISSKARDEIIQEWKDNGFEKYDGYYFKRHTFYLGRWINHGGWYPDYKLRLFRKSKGKWGGDDPHDRVIIQKPAIIKKFQGEILHYTYKNISHHLKKIDNFSDYAMKSLLSKNKRYNFFNLFLRPHVKFLEIYLWKLGFLDGMPGLIIAVLSSYYIFIRYAKLWEFKKVKKKIEHDSAQFSFKEKQ